MMDRLECVCGGEILGEREILGEIEREILGERERVWGVISGEIQSMVLLCPKLCPDSRRGSERGREKEKER